MSHDETPEETPEGFVLLPKSEPESRPDDKYFTRPVKRCDNSDKKKRLELAYKMVKPPPDNVTLPQALYLQNLRNPQDGFVVLPETDAEKKIYDKRQELVEIDGNCKKADELLLQWIFRGLYTTHK